MLLLIEHLIQIIGTACLLSQNKVGCVVSPYGVRRIESQVRGDWKELVNGRVEKEGHSINGTTGTNCPDEAIEKAVDRRTREKIQVDSKPIRRRLVVDRRSNKIVDRRSNARIERDDTGHCRTSAEDNSTNRNAG